MSYLKALGILRVLARQVDSEARGRWGREAFVVDSPLEPAELADFLLDRFAPSPAVSPWNGGSGFFPKDRKDGIDWIESSSDPRLAAYRRAISIARRALDDLGPEERPTGDAKALLIRRLRRTLDDDALDWLDTAVVVTGTQLAYPPLLGSGGNDGRFDFSNNLMQCIQAVVDPAQRERSAQMLAATLNGGYAVLDKRSLAHFVRDASPVNSPRGESDSLGNPWDLVLAVEGSLVLAAGSSRRHGSQLPAGLAAPFTVRSTGTGFGSAVAGEKGRAELWLPLWDKSAKLREIESLVREARAQVGRRPARTGLDFARAAGGLGVARGIRAFERYAILERAGQSSLAVPGGRIEVRPNPGAEALQTLDPWIDRVLGFALSAQASRSIQIAGRRLERAMFQLAATGSSVAAQATLERLGDVEHVLARSVRAADVGLSPLVRATAEPWLLVANDGSPEFAVAAGLASLRWLGRPSRRIRDYLHGTVIREKDDRNRRVFDPRSARAVTTLAAPVTRLARLHARAVLDELGSPDPDDAPPDRHGVPPPVGLTTDIGAARAFAAGELDDRRVLALAGGLALFDFQSASPPHPDGVDAPPTPAYDLLALAWRGLPGKPLWPRRGWAARLAAGNCRFVLGDARLRLREHSLPPIVSVDDLTSIEPDGARLGAALLLALDTGARRQIAERLTDHQPHDKRLAMAKEAR